MDRIGYYCWAGPGTTRMINLKFFNPKIDKDSLMQSYDYEYLSKVKELFGITDFFATYSWGFSDSTEMEDRKFLEDRVENFHKLGLKLHTYVQGPNLVYSEFPNKDWWCRDQKGRLITYYRGRKNVCVNNPEFREYIENKIRSTFAKGLDAIFMDNIQMGQLGIPVPTGQNPFCFAGCNCDYCNKSFQAKTGDKIPADFEKDIELTKQYLEFRADSMKDFLSFVSSIVHEGGMEFGGNCFDPKYDTLQTYGFRVEDVADIFDYILFENHSLGGSPEASRNTYIESISSKINKPVFVVSYKKEIGKDAQYSQADFDHLYSEDSKYNFFACLKGSEYFTKGKWHNLYLDKLSKPKKDVILIPEIFKVKDHGMIRNKLFRRFLKEYYNPLTKFAFESRVGSKLKSFAFNF